MLALSIRQPFAELILRGIKTVEYRTRRTRVIGEPFYIYASKGAALRGRGAAGNVWSRDLTGGQPPAWMLELAEQVRMIDPGLLLPTGVIVGTAVVEKCVPVADVALPPTAMSPPPACYAWHLRDVERVDQPRKPARMPQPAWFRPF